MKVATVLLANLLAVLFSICSAEKLRAQSQPIEIWRNGVPSAIGTDKKDIPTLTPYLTREGIGPAVLLIPGGSYSGIFEPQAEPFARWLNDQGLHVLVLRYRLGSAGYRYPAQLQDAAEAMRLIRANASQWQVDPARIGVMGFSAGGHLASTLITQPEDGDAPNASGSPEISSRPTLAVLCYPVISMTTKPHLTSLHNLVGESPTEERLARTSTELQVHAGLPPVFIWHTSEDVMVPVEHAQLFAASLHRYKVPHELHLYQKGDHGTGLIGTDHPWFNDLLFWLRANEFLHADHESPERKTEE